MLKQILHKILCSALLLCMAFMCQGRQLYTVADGDWSDAAVWVNQLLPNSTYDTIEILNRVSLNSTFLMDHDDVLTIDSSAWICGTGILQMQDNAQAYINGYLGANQVYVFSLNNYFFMGAHATVITDNWGFLLTGDSALQLHESTGSCITEHTSGGTCAVPCVYNSTIYTYYNGPIVDFEVDSNATPDNYKYYFGDGDSSWNYTTFYQAHNYRDTGYYNVTVIFVPCCTMDTLRTTVHITSLTTGILPTAWCNTTEAFIKGPNPANDVLQLGHTFCTDVQGAIKLYSLTGGLVYTAPFATTGQRFNATIPVSNLPAACYILSVETADAAYHQRIIVAH